MIRITIITSIGMDKLNIWQDHFIVLNTRDTTRNCLHLTRVPGQVNGFNRNVFETLFWVFIKFK